MRASFDGHRLHVSNQNESNVTSWNKNAARSQHVLDRNPHVRLDGQTDTLECDASDLVSERMHSSMSRQAKLTNSKEREHVFINTDDVLHHPKHDPTIKHTLSLMLLAIARIPFFFAF